MICPLDGTELQKVHIMNVALDKCHKCDGIWFDKGELDIIRDSCVENVEEVLEKKYGDPSYTESQTEGYMKCPACNGKLHRHNYSYVSPVHIDSCSSCYGKWLDDGELNKIVGQKKELDEEFSPSRMKNLFSFLRSILK